MHYKGLSDLVWEKDGPEGSLRATFSRFDVVDRDGDVTLPTFFKDGQAVPMVWAHDWSKPIGKGVIRVLKDRAVFDGAFFLDTADGVNAYRTVKNMAELQQYSYGYQPFEAEPGEFKGQQVRFLKTGETYEVSPVLVGAGRDTRTEAIKQHGPILYDATGRPIDTTGVTAADVARLLGPEVKRILESTDGYGLSFDEHSEKVRVALEELLERVRSGSEIRAQEKVGRPISEARRARMTVVQGWLGDAHGEIGALLDETAPQPKNAPAGSAETATDPAVAALFAETQRLLARYGVPTEGDD